MARTTAWWWFTGTTARPPELAGGLERLTDAATARQIVEAIPSRNGATSVVRNTR